MGPAADKIFRGELHLPSLMFLKSFDKAIGWPVLTTMCEGSIKRLAAGKLPYVRGAVTARLCLCFPHAVLRAAKRLMHASFHCTSRVDDVSLSYITLTQLVMKSLALRRTT